VRGAARRAHSFAKYANEWGTPKVTWGTLRWRWSSFRAYCYAERGLVRVNFQEWVSRIKARPVEKFSEGSSTQRPFIRKVRE